MTSDKVWEGLEPLLPKEQVPNRAAFQELVQDPVFRGQIVSMLSNDPAFADFLRSNSLSELTTEVKPGDMSRMPGPAELAARINANERLAGLLSQPNVQQAVNRIAEDPSTLADYKADPEVMQVMEFLREFGME